MSGGKDSTAMLLMIIEKDMTVDRIMFADVGKKAEFDEMYEYLDRLERYINRPIERIKSEKWTFDNVFYGHPSRGGYTHRIRGFTVCPTVNLTCRFRSWLKLDPLAKANGSGNTIYIGIAADEAHRAERKIYVGQKNSYAFPLIKMGLTEADCIKICRDRGLHNPLYDRFSRLGCWQCAKQSKKSLKALFRFYPKKWERLLEYQAACPWWPFHPGKSVNDYDREFRKLYNVVDKCK